MVKVAPCEKILQLFFESRNYLQKSWKLFLTIHFLLLPALSSASYIYWHSYLSLRACPPPLAGIATTPCPHDYLLVLQCPVSCASLAAPLSLHSYPYAHAWLLRSACVSGVMHITRYLPVFACKVPCVGTATYTTWCGQCHKLA